MLDSILAMKEAGGEIPVCDAAADYLRIYEEHADRLKDIIDEDALKAEVEDLLRSYMSELEEAEVKARKAVELHELAKETFGIWQSSGIFARQRALRRLRKSAGFRLESHRIGNYVAKTYDLMEEARRAQQKAQQELFAANVSYKCRADVYRLMAEALR